MNESGNPLSLPSTKVRSKKRANYKKACLDVLCSVEQAGSVSLCNILSHLGLHSVTPRYILVTDFEDAAGFFSGFDVSEEADEVKGGCSEVLASVR